MKCPQHYLTEIQEVVLFYNGLDVLTRQILDSKGVIPSKTAADAKVAIQEIAEYSQKWHNGTSRTRRGRYRATAPGFYQRNNGNPSYQERRQSMEETLSKFMSESAKRHEENSNLIKEIRASTDASIRNQEASIKTLEIQIGQISKSISTIVEADSYPIRRMGSSQYAVSTRQNRTLLYETKQTTIPFLSRLNACHCEEKKGSYEPQFSEAYSEASHINNSIPKEEKDPRRSAHTKLTVELADRTVKYPKGIAENMLVGIGKFIFPVDFIILDMPEDIKVPLILGRPFLSTAYAKIDVFKRKIILRVGEEKIIFKSVKPASSLIKRVYMLSLRERMELGLEARLMGETLVLNRSLDPFFKDYIKLNNLNVPLELRRDKVDDLLPTIEEDFAVLEDMDAYRDEGMGDVIFGKLFLREVGINAKRFEGMITIYNGEEDKMTGISHSYQKLKRFYKGVLNLGPDFIRVSSMEEWLTRGHVSMHEMK
ncbi:hypothetical protein Tco_0858623 [Tanacetum coccineum]|uniref:Reverse transcriptase domain-containing protein n=1 Tax=Tanacetum coccineum TaxID=301880 RepID=A0ABQ5BDF5_9ASTR